MHSVSDQGAALYSIPLALPPGTNSLAPSLALTYSSSDESTILGVGWSISGLSRIARCARTWAQDAESRDVRNDYSDRFCLDGNKLRLTGGTYGSAGATYQTEIETFSRVTSYGSAGNGPSYFVVETKDGLIHEYGNSTDSRIESVGQPTARAWALNKIRDRSGNAISFTYTEDAVNGSYRVASIAYASNATQGVSAPYSVEFVYETKPSSEIDSGYIAGSVVKQITRLDRIDVKHLTTVVRRYELTYEGALSSTSKSRLASVQECAGAALDCFPATTFSYQNGTSGLGANTNTGVSVPTAPWVLDVNGDGRDDLVYSSNTTSGSGQWMVMFANASGGYNSPIAGPVNTNYADAIPVDYNADGLQDVLVPYAGGTWWVMLGTASGLAAHSNTGAPVTATGKGTSARAMDVNGDGLDDLVWMDLIGYPGGDAIRYRLREWGGTFSSAVYTLVGPLPPDFKLSGGAFPAGQNSRLKIPDFNGDGRGDFIYGRTRRVWDDEQQKYITTPTLVAHCVGAWEIEASWLTGSPARFFGDFNGDGKTDLLYRDVSGSHRMQFSTGKSLTNNILVSAPSVTVQAILDWDGDGYDDALASHATNGTWYVMRSTGEGFSAPVATGLSAGTAPFTVMDMNGDGLTDFANTVSGVLDYRPRSGIHPDLLQTAADGFGNSITFNYVPVSQGSYTKYADASYPEQDYQGSLHVVSSSSASDGVGGTYTSTFWYYGARVNLQGRGLEGFYARYSGDSRNGLHRYDYAHRAFPYTGSIYQSDLVQPDNVTLIARTENTWTAHSYGSGYETRSLPYVSQSTNSHYEAGGAYSGQLIRTVLQQYSVEYSTGTLHDTIKTISEPGSANGIQAGATYVQRTYRPTAYLSTDWANWCIGRPGRTEVISYHNQYGGGAITRTTSTAWDASACRPTQIQEEPGHAQLQVTRVLGYDPFGNINSDSVTGIGMSPRTTTLNWGTTGQFPLSVTNALSQTTQFAWDPAIGTLTSVTDPNNTTTSWQYDGFGRRTREDRPDGTASTWSLLQCPAPSYCGDSTLRYYLQSALRDTANAVVWEGYRFFDGFDRLKYDEPRYLNGYYGYSVTVYDALGRVAQTNAPTFPRGRRCIGRRINTICSTASHKSLVRSPTPIRRFRPRISTTKG